jgi:hypothetical protein
MNSKPGWPGKLNINDDMHVLNFSNLSGADD